MTIAVIKRCLHPKSAQVRKVDRTPQYERVFSWVVEHDHSVRRPVEGVVATLPLPYTDQELRQLPVIQTLTTTFWQDTAAIVGIRGVERTVPFVVFSQN
jgi:hypothetical protein